MSMPKDPIRYEEARKNMSESHKGKKLSPEHRKKIGEAGKGRQKSQEWKDKIGASNRRVYSDPIRRKEMSIRSKRNWADPEFVENLRQKNMGEKNPQFGKPTSERQKESAKYAKQGSRGSYESRLKLTERNYVRDGSGFWYGGVRYYDGPQYCERWTEGLKERVRAYRGYICFECDSPQDGNRLDVHHVHYNKKACCDNSPKLLVPLCKSCHIKTNTNRKSWTDHFIDMIYALDSDGKCFFTKEEMKEYKGIK